MERVRPLSFVLALALVAFASTSNAQPRQTFDAPAPAQTACATAQRAFTATVNAAAARLPRRATATVSTWGFNYCLPANRGVWRLTADNIALRDSPYVRSLSGGTIHAVFYSATGAAIRAPHELLGVFGSVSTRPSGASTVVEDVDGDGLGDLVLSNVTANQRSVIVLTARSGAIEALAVPSTINVNAIESVDQDDRRELVEHVRFEPPSSCEPDEGVVTSVDALMFAAFRDGTTYRVDGDASRALLRAQCPERPAVIVPHHGITASNAGEVFREAIQRVACARVWGMSPEAIARTFPTRWPSAWSCTSAAHFTAFAAGVRPPVVLAPLARITVARDAETNFEPIDVDDFAPEGRITDEALPAAQRACRANGARVSATYAALIRQSRGNLSQEELDDFFGSYGSCYVGEPRDAWMSTFVRMRWDPSAADDEPGILGQGRIVHVGAHGTASDRPTAVERLYESSTLRQVFASYDFDNDGSSEALVRAHSSGSESDGEVSFEILTVRGAAVRAYEPAGGIPTFERIVDYDDDGRPDLLDYRAYVLSSDDEGGATYGLKVIAHGRNDGTFSQDDSVARDFIRAQCTAPPQRLVVIEGNDIERAATFGAILCARFWGEGSERIVQRMFTDTAQLEESDRDWLRGAARAALWRTPFVLSAPAAATVGANRGATRP